MFADRSLTIVAIATPPGRGGVGIVRLSGPDAAGIAGGMFRSARADFAGFRPYRLHHGWVVDAGGRHLDEVMAALLPGPGSYTGEDSVEINCHGGPAVLAAVLEIALAAGAVPAGPGEFTYRAFMNGRMDLTQAEAVAEMIDAPARTAFIQAQNRLEGLLGRRVAELRASLEDLRAELCVAVDFPEDEVEVLAPDRLIASVREVSAALDNLLANYRRTRRFREGALVVLAGTVNVGKSSLLNALLGRERAIVTPLPGTTRDYIEETLDLDGLPLRLVDTAGLRDSQDEIENIGLAKGRALIEAADLTVVVLDGSRPALPHELDLATELGPDRALILLNKADLPASHAPDLPPAFTTAAISARTGQGLEAFATLLRARLASGTETTSGDLVPNLRQAQAISSALDELAALVRDTQASLPYDVLSVRLEAACRHLAGLTGDIAPEEVLNKVFSSFCIGK